MDLNNLQRREVKEAIMAEVVKIRDETLIGEYKGVHALAQKGDKVIIKIESADSRDSLELLRYTVNHLFVEVQKTEVKVTPYRERIK